MRLPKVIPAAMVAVISLACSQPPDAGAPSTQSEATVPATESTPPKPAAEAVTPSSPGSTVEPDSRPRPNAAATSEPDRKPKGDSIREQAKVEPEPAKRIDAADLYTQYNCSACHGGDGRGNRVVVNTPDFTSAEWQQSRSDAELTKAIKAGKRPMPAYEARLNDDEVKALVTYVRSLRK